MGNIDANKIVEADAVGLIVHDEEGIHQFGMTQDQKLALNVFLSNMTRQHPFVKMGSEYDLVLKSMVKKMKK